MLEYISLRNFSLTAMTGDVGDINLLLVNGHKRQAGQSIKQGS